MVFEHLSVEHIPVIYLSFTVRALSTCTIKPLLEDFSVVGMRVFYGLAEYLVIFRGSVVWVILVPRRDVYSELEPILPAGLRELLEDIAFAVAPFALGYGVCALRVWPDAETVVMLCGYDDAFETGFLGYGCPLTTIHFCRIECVYTFISVAPLHVGECVRAEMHEHIGLHLLPLYLGRRWQRSEWFRSRRAA